MYLKMENFSKRIKNEISEFNWNNKQILLMINLFLYLSDSSNFWIKNNELKLKFEDSLKGKGIDYKLETKKNKFYFSINNHKRKELNDFAFDLTLIKAFFAAWFLSKGSINSPISKYYHLELRISNESDYHFINKFLSEYQIKFKFYNSPRGPYIYLKRASEIGNFISLINSHKCLLEFENTRVEREFENSLKRYGNIDIININKTVNASQKQIQKIKYLIENNILEKHKQKYREIAKLRLENPESNLEDLCNQYNKKFKENYTKSAINHWLRFILKL